MSARLSQDDVHRLHGLVVRLGLDREALLEMVNPKFVAAIPARPDESTQILADLSRLNSVGILADGSDPLATWLRNATSLSAVYPESAQFRVYLARLKPSNGLDGPPLSQPVMKTWQTRKVRRITLVVVTLVATIALVGLTALAIPRFLQPQGQKTNLFASDCPPEMVFVLGGTFEATAPYQQGIEAVVKRVTTTVPSYCIEKTEVTVDDYLSCFRTAYCTAATGPVRFDGPAPGEIEGLSRYCTANDVNRRDHGNHPINCVSWNQANAYCKWRGWRLPTEAEWEYAAVGNKGTLYPWGNERPTAQHLNALGPDGFEAIIKLLGPRAFPDAKPLYDTPDGWPATAPVGLFPLGKSPFGVLDLAGNVSEWVASRADSTDPAEPDASAQHVIRGSQWTHVDIKKIQMSYRRPFPADNTLASVGFRCAK